MQKEILITGLGVISAIGNSVAENLASLKSGKSGIDKIQFLQTIHKDTFKVGEVKLSNLQMCDLLGLSANDYKKQTRTSLLAIMAAKEALQSAGLAPDGLNRRIGVVSATTVGGMDKTELEYADRNFDSGFIQTHPSGDSTDSIAEYLKIGGYRTTISTACSSAANAIIHAAKLIQHGYLDMALVGGTDALSKFTLNGFNSLMILDKDFCKPFDQNRQGLNLGEGAGFLIIESVESAKKRHAKVFCKLAGFANTNDAYHQTASSPEGEGAYRAMQEALKMSGLNIGDIDYINVHGTGTNNNDLSEGVALKHIFGDHLPPFSSTKSFTGHTLGAAAGIEAVFSILAILHGIVYPNLNFTTAMEELGIYPQTELITDCNIQHVLSNSFGFGGNNSTLVFSK
ncbi:MAG: beta-ketoacyl-[acyl-carrier-protein] synthase family protein [Prolixibacteraceae bacterium]|nr:beta-ketoacyl-[acyl-carrier-protein] synthase family protein [Prolixibacteraceae bacterium]